jgi:putative (di)nucleoside polyphosphate hydrolase
MAKPHFRAGVVAVVSRSDGRVMAFERADMSGEWQLPQGGIETGETPVAAAWRELAEETGLGPTQVRLAGEYPEWTVYEWPAAVRNSSRGSAARFGQAHRWFFFDLIDDTTEPAPDGHEFGRWKWVDPIELVDGVVDFRRAPYRQVLGSVAGDRG